MPYRIDITGAHPDVLDRLVQLGALDVEPVGDGIAAILPDGVEPDSVSAALGGARVIVSAAVARDNGSVWLLNPRPVQIGGVLIAPPDMAAPPDALRLKDSDVFGTGHHATTALCIGALEEILAFERIDSVLDVGTGSGILALAALKLGVPKAVGLDIDAEALEAAAANARLNHLGDRLELVFGGPDILQGTWPLVVANILAAPLMEMAPSLVRLLARRGRLILSGIPWSVASEVRQAYEHLGVRHFASRERDGWVAVAAQATW